MDQLQPKRGNLLAIVLVILSFYEYYVFLMFQTSLIMAQDWINCMHNTKKDLLLLLLENVVSTHGAAATLNRESHEFFISFSIILYYAFLLMNSYKNAQGWNSIAPTYFS